MRQPPPPKCLPADIILMMGFDGWMIERQADVNYHYFSIKANIDARLWWATTMANVNTTLNISLMADIGLFTIRLSNLIAGTHAIYIYISMSRTPWCYYRDIFLIAYSQFTSPPLFSADYLWISRVHRHRAAVILFSFFSPLILGFW